MGTLFNVSIINKYDVWLKEDEENSSNWSVMNRELLESILKRKIRKSEERKGRAIIGYDDIIWRKFV